MLDNLKLGYGGTKTEMERLLADAEKISGVKYNISNLSDVYNAIHVIQEELGVTGTTAEEAEKTISGSVNSMKAAFDNFLNGSGSPEALAESVTNVLNNIGNAVVKLAPNILSGVVELIQTLLPKVIALLLETLPQLLDAVGKMIKSLLDMVKGNPDKVAEAITEVINQIITFLTDNLPLIIDLGIQILFALINGIISSIPKLIEELPKLITTIVSVLWNNKGKILEAGKNILIAIKDGIINNISTLQAKIKEIPGKLKNWLIEGISKIKDAGKQLIAGLWNGVEEKWESLKNKVKDFGNGIVKKFKSVFGIASPSKVFKKVIGTNLALGIEEGFTDTMDKASKTMANSIPVNSLVTNVDSAMRNLSYGIEHSINPTINPNISLDTNYNLMALAVKEALKDMDIELDDREVGKFVTKTITNEVY